MPYETFYCSYTLLAFSKLSLYYHLVAAGRNYNNTCELVWLYNSVFTFVQHVGSYGEAAEAVTVLSSSSLTSCARLWR